MLKHRQGFVQMAERFGVEFLGNGIHVTLIKLINLLTQIKPLIGQLNACRTFIMRRALLNEVGIFDKLFHVVGNVGTKVVTTVRQLADGQLFSANIIKDQSLDVVHIINLKTIKLGLDNIKKAPVQTFNQQNRICINLFQDNASCSYFTSTLTLGAKS